MVLRTQLSIEIDRNEVLVLELQTTRYLSVEFGACIPSSLSGTFFVPSPSARDESSGRGPQPCQAKPG